MVMDPVWLIIAPTVTGPAITTLSDATGTKPPTQVPGVAQVPPVPVLVTVAAFNPEKARSIRVKNSRAILPDILPIIFNPGRLRVVSDENSIPSEA